MVRLWENGEHQGTPSEWLCVTGTRDSLSLLYLLVDMWSAILNLKELLLPKSSLSLSLSLCVCVCVLTRVPADMDWD